MPALANMTVKKANGSTDVTYSYQQGASGDIPATFFAPALGANASTRPELRISSKAIPREPNKRRVSATYMMPYSVVNSTTGLTTVEKKLLMKLTTDTDFDVPDAVIDEWAHQGLNLFAHALTKLSAKEGIAPT